jgi:hypothetical protein
MDNLKTKCIDKILIEDDTNDSFFSTSSNSSNKNNKNIQNNKNLFGKYIKKDDYKTKTTIKTTIKKPFTKPFTKNYPVKNETKTILETSYINFQKSNEKYYNDVLEWLNMTFNDNATSILKVQLKKITLNEDIFNKYNNIIKNYKLKKKLFDIDNFDFNGDYNYDAIAEIAKIMTKNIIEKLNYKLDMYKTGDTKKMRIKNISKEI